MQRNIAMKFARYVAWILQCKPGKFGEKNYYNSTDIELFPRGLFLLARPVYLEQDSPVDARITRDSSACIWRPLL